MSHMREKLEGRMDVLAKEVGDLQTRLLQLNAKLATEGFRDLLSRGIVASYQLDRAYDELARLPGSGSGGGTGQHNPDPTEGGGLRPL